MTQQLKVKLPGTLYFIDLTMNPATNTGKVTLERKAVEAQKTLSDLNPHSIQGVLLDLLDAQGLNPNPRLISRLLEDLTEPTEVAAAASPPVEESLPETPVDEVTHEVPAPVEIMTNDPHLKVKDILAAATFQMSQLDSLLKESSNTEVESAMKSLQNLLMQAKSVINEIITD